MNHDRAFLGISHSPLIGLNPVEPSVLHELEGAMDAIRNFVRDFDPQLVLMIGPDHYNGFFHELMPPFCVGSAATAVGDYQTLAGPLNVESKVALELSEWLMNHDFDIAHSNRMRVDHAFAQVIQILWGGLNTPQLIPIFMNAVAPPAVARIRRCYSLGLSIGEFLDQLTLRILVIASGGLSHDPPVPTLEHSDPKVREGITSRQELTPTERDAKTQRVMAAGMALASGKSTMKELNPSWDRVWMNAIESGDFEPLLAYSESSITELGGGAAHESKSWLVGRAATLGATMTSRFKHYQAIPEYIAGYGALYMQSIASV